MRTSLAAVLLLRLSAPAAAQMALPSAREALERARNSEIPAVTAPALAPIGPGSSTQLSASDLQDPQKLAEVSSAYFEAYIGEIGLGFIPRALARSKFAEAQQWTIPFLQSHFDRLTLSMEQREVAGEKRLVIVSQSEYNGHAVAILRFKDGIESVSVVSVDGRLATDASGGLYRVVTKDRANFDRFVEWFEGHLGKPAKK